MVLIRKMNVMLLVAVVAIAPVLLVIAWKTGLIAVLGSGVMALALATVGLLRVRRPRAALVCLLAHISISIQLVAMLNLVDAANYWNWTIWPAAAGVVMLLAGRDRARVLSG